MLGPKPLPVGPMHGDREPDGQEGVTMGIGRRIAQLYEVKVNALLDRAEDPREALDYSYARQQELLLRIRRAITEVAAARTRAQMQESRLRRTAARLQRQARQAAAAGRDELAAVVPDVVGQLAIEHLSLLFVVMGIAHGHLVAGLSVHSCCSCPPVLRVLPLG
jgi:hypothetical protein